MGTKKPTVVSGPEDENEQIEDLGLFNKSGLNPKNLEMIISWEPFFPLFSSSQL